LVLDWGDTASRSPVDGGGEGLRLVDSEGLSTLGLSHGWLVAEELSVFVVVQVSQVVDAEGVGEG